MKGSGSTRKVPSDTTTLADMKIASLYKAVEEYKQSAVEINGELAYGLVTDPIQQMVDALDTQMITINQELSRITDEDILSIYMEQTGARTLKDLIGKVITNTPYMSTSEIPLDKHIKRNKAELYGMEGMVGIKILPSPKTKGFNIGEFVRKNKNKMNTPFEDESEVILARKSRFKVVDAKTKYYFGEPFSIITIQAI